MYMNVSTHNLTTLTKDIADIRQQVPEIGRRIMSDLSSRLVLSARVRAAPLGSGTGRLKNSIRAQWLNQYSLRVSAGEGITGSYPYFQEVGFRPHYVHRSQWHGNNWTSTSDFAYVRRSTPYMRPAINNIITPQKIDEVIEKHVESMEV